MPVQSPEHIYVHYRLRGDPAAARAAVARLFADLEMRTGVSGRLLERRGGPRTWLEVYEPVPEPGRFLRVLRAAARRHGLVALAFESRRAVLRFALPPAPRAAAGAG